MLNSDEVALHVNQLTAVPCGTRKRIKFAFLTFQSLTELFVNDKWITFVEMDYFCRRQKLGRKLLYLSAEAPAVSIIRYLTQKGRSERCIESLFFKVPWNSWLTGDSCGVAVQGWRYYLAKCTLWYQLTGNGCLSFTETWMVAEKVAVKVPPILNLGPSAKALASISVYVILCVVHTWKRTLPLELSNGHVFLTAWFYFFSWHLWEMAAEMRLGRSGTFARRGELGDSGWAESSRQIWQQRRLLTHLWKQVNTAGQHSHPAQKQE